MKKVLILGASGQIAQLVEHELADKVDMTLFLRNKNKLTNPNGKVIVGDATNLEDLKSAMRGQDIIYSNLGPTYMAKMADAVVKAAIAENVQRIIWVATAGIYTEYLPGHQQKMEAEYGKVSDAHSYMGDERIGADIIDDSSLESTIIRPNILTDEDEIQTIVTTQKNDNLLGGPVSRKTVAHFISELILEPNQHINESISISKQ
ncbi:NAD(P)H-binding protein [Lentilactobacillus laojiaonis]|uniref:NAD(P)H-binding protein n=1 Tax=Lentilactobacillus laojiaonis TaxID=2883998 RepID=UPI001D09DE48|nr:NAD(P)H-binding protein [Lentilactobacillus laojiaonis]UDM32312.1 NAD(P)H-binding protein [Lentilactobacillus laojiaonis]